MAVSVVTLAEVYEGISQSPDEVASFELDVCLLEEIV